MKGGDERTPPPHHFPSSPVQEVFCEWVSRDGRYSRSFPAPYPGWHVIRSEIERMIPASDSGIGITSCRLTYTDFFSEKLCAGIEWKTSLTVLVNQSEFERPVTDEERGIPVRSTIPQTRASVLMQTGREAGRGVRIVFMWQTVGKVSWNRESCLSWFDQAHTGIHHAFDELVPGAIIDRMR